MIVPFSSLELVKFGEIEDILRLQDFETSRLRDFDLKLGLPFSSAVSSTSNTKVDFVVSSSGHAGPVTPLGAPGCPGPCLAGGRFWQPRLVTMADHLGQKQNMRQVALDQSNK